MTDTAKVIPFSPKKVYQQYNAHCAFCGLVKSKVQTLVGDVDQGPCICGDCIARCGELMKD